MSMNRGYIAQMVIEEVRSLYHGAGLDQRVADLLAHLLGVAVPPESGPAAQAWDPYRVLGVEPDDPPELVEAVYRAKAKFRHPDNRHYGSALIFQQLQQAYQEVKRR